VSRHPSPLPRAATGGPALAAILGLLLLAGCATAPRGPADAARPLAEAPRAQPERLPPPTCVPMREHDESLYTAGGLYAPGVPDRGPPRPVHVDHLPEPVPRREPRARHGNMPSYSVLGRTFRVMDSAEGFVERGTASWYGYKFHGRHTSSRELYDMCAFTAAHRNLPLPTYVRVTHLGNGRSVVVRVNDRGPFHGDRIIDLSYAAARRIGMVEAGTAPVEVRVLKEPYPQVAAARPDPRRPDARRPGGRSEPAGEGPQVVQVGAFGDRMNAERLVRQLEDAGLPGARLDHAIVNERSVWRVRFPAQAAAAAAALADRVLASGLAAPRLFRAEP
jgi:rare lipoprotein A